MKVLGAGLVAMLMAVAGCSSNSGRAAAPTPHSSGPSITDNFPPVPTDALRADCYGVLVHGRRVTGSQYDNCKNVGENETEMAWDPCTRPLLVFYAWGPVGPPKRWIITAGGPAYRTGETMDMDAIARKLCPV